MVKSCNYVGLSRQQAFPRKGRSFPQRPKVADNSLRTTPIAPLDIPELNHRNLIGYVREEFGGKIVCGHISIDFLEYISFPTAANCILESLKRARQLDARSDSNRRLHS